MPRPLLFLALGALLSLSAVQAQALGFGRVNDATMLGQPLNFAVGVRLDDGEKLGADCVSAEVLAGENRLLSSLTIEPGSDPGERILRVRSSTPVDEPVVSVNVQITCGSRMARKFVAFVDPPAVQLAQSAVQAPAASTKRSEAATAPVVAAAAAAAKPAAKAPSAKTAARTRRTAPPVAVAKVGKPSATAVSRPQASSARPGPSAAKVARAPTAPTGARLKLEAVEDGATRERLDLRMSGALAPVPAAAASAVAPAPAAIDDEAARRARERMLALEEKLAKLGAESQATRAALAQLQLRLRDAEAERHANSLVYGLAALAAVLAVALGLLLWRRTVERRAVSQWWAPAATVAGTPAASGLHWSSAQPEPHADEGMPSAGQADLAETTASPMLLMQAHTLADAASDARPHGAAPADELSVEELIDLEQQAEFFVVLGQDEAAVDLLMGHLRSSGGASPLPYLKLLEIYRRRDEREAYERIRERFNRRFNAYAPDWQADPQQGRTLPDYPAVMARLQALWATPTLTMQALETSLFRRDGSSSTFDLPAYRELLFLYAIARDLSTQPAPLASVDLLLPIGGEALDMQTSLTRLHPTPMTDLSVEQPNALDLDITCLDGDPSASDERGSRFRTDFGPTSGYLGLPAGPDAKAA